MPQVRRRMGAALLAAALVSTLAGCSLVEQIGDARDSVETAGDQGAALDRLSADLAALDGVDGVEISSHLFDFPPTAEVRVAMAEGATADAWGAAAGLVADAVHAAPLSGVRIAAAQHAPDLQLDYPTAGDIDPLAEVGFATALREAIGPGLVVVVEGVGEGYRTVGSIDRSDSSTTLGLVANADAVRAVVADAADRPTQWALPGLSSTLVPPDVVLALIANSPSPLPPSVMPGDVVDEPFDEPFLWYGFNRVGEVDQVILGFLDPGATAPADSPLWVDYVARARSVPAAVEGTVVFNAVWATGAGIVMGVACESAGATADDRTVAAALSDAGLVLDHFTVGACAG